MQALQVDEAGILDRFRKKTASSAEAFRRAQGVTPGGIMGGIKLFDPYPVFMERGRGSRLWDLDGNEYIDYLMSFGALVLGHGADAVKAAIESTLRTTGSTVTGAPTELEAEYGGMLRDRYHKGGMLRFTNSGLEATLLAVRLARARTGRRKVAKFEGHYHGAVDHLLVSYSPGLGAAGPAASPAPVGDSIEVDGGILSDSLVLPFNDWEGTERLLTEHSDELACVIMEPFEEGVIAGERKFMSDLRGFTRDARIPLIYDEVKTGFRVRLGGASEYYSITPDITCLGKIIGGGLPIGAVAGDAGILELLDPRRGPGTRVFHSGTFNGNPLSLGAGKATVEELSSKGRFQGLVSRTDALKRKVSQKLKERQLPSVMAGEGAVFNFYLNDGPVTNYREAKGSDLRTRRFLDLELLTRGVYLKPENRFSLSLAHTDEDVSVTAERFGESLDSLISGAAR